MLGRNGASKTEKYPFSSVSTAEFPSPGEGVGWEGFWMELPALLGGHTELNLRAGPSRMALNWFLTGIGILTLI